MLIVLKFSQLELADKLVSELRSRGLKAALLDVREGDRARRVKVVLDEVSKANEPVILIGIGGSGRTLLTMLSQVNSQAVKGLVLISVPNVIDYIDEIARFRKPTLLIWTIQDPHAPVEEAAYVQSAVRYASLKVLRGNLGESLGEAALAIGEWVNSIKPD